ADPYVQFPGYSQSFNRYSYVLNNPLAFVDPSGYCIAAGPSCPTSGFGGFSRGLGGLTGRARPALLNWTRRMTIIRGFSISWGGGLPSTGGGACFVAGGCIGGPVIFHNDL